MTDRPGFFCPYLQQHLRRVFAGVALFAFGTSASGVPQSLSDFSGTWVLDAARSGQAREVWFVSRAHKFIINQTASELAIDSDGSIADVAGPLVYKLDGSEITTANLSMGDIPGWTRKIQTKAILDGATVVTYTSHVSETTDRNKGSTRETVGVTIVLTFTLSSNGRDLIVERTGFRPVPPPTLHDRPYRQEDDLVYRKDTATYVKSHDH